MSRLRVYFTELLIVTPLLIACALAALFLLHELPRLEAAQAEQVKAGYRELAEAIRDGEAKGVRHYRLGKKACGRMSGGTWGFEPAEVKMGEPAMTLVWYRPPRSEKRLGVRTPTAAVSNLRRRYGLVGLAAIAIFLLLTNLGLRRFRRFLKEREDFLAAVVHDLTTPLIGMRMTIARDDDEAKRLNERLLLIVDNLKAFLLRGGRRAKPKKERFDLLTAAKTAYLLFREDYRDLFEGNDVDILGTDPAELGTDPAKALPVEVFADETLTLQILWNLFGNDLKYAAPYGKVRVRGYLKGKAAKLEFLDEGPGMIARQRRHAFDRYYRARTVKESGKGGFGIGLCSAREAARSMGGDLTVTANSPRGCIFTLTLPRYQIETEGTRQ